MSFTLFLCNIHKIRKSGATTGLHGAVDKKAEAGTGEVIKHEFELERLANLFFVIVEYSSIIITIYAICCLNSAWIITYR